MKVLDVIAKKGKHFKVIEHAEVGSAYIIYDDVKISVRQWDKENSGRVTHVEPMSERLRQYKDYSYEDEIK